MKSLEELHAIRVSMKQRLMNRGVIALNDTVITVGMSSEAVAAGARELVKAVAEKIEADNLSNIKFCQSGDLAIAGAEPLVEVLVPGQKKVIYAKVNKGMLDEIFESHIKGKKPLAKYTYSEGR